MEEKEDKTVLQINTGRGSDVKEEIQQTPYGRVTEQRNPLPPGGYGVTVITEEELPAKFKPLGAWAYFGYSLLFSVVPFGWIVAIVFAVGKTENVNLRNFSRSFFCYLVVIAVLFVLIFGVAGCTIGSAMYL